MVCIATKICDMIYDLRATTPMRSADQSGEETGGSINNRSGCSVVLCLAPSRAPSVGRGRVNALPPKDMPAVFCSRCPVRRLRSLPARRHH